MKSFQVETIYRAKKIDSDKYVEGNYCNEFDGSTEDMIVKVGSPMFKYDAIDKSTLAIHFTNSSMEDSEGTKIFASLSSDGNGGDTVSSHKPLNVVILIDGNTRVIGLEDNKYERDYSLIRNFLINGTLPDRDKSNHRTTLKVTGIHTVGKPS